MKVSRSSHASKALLALHSVLRSRGAEELQNRQSAPCFSHPLDFWDFGKEALLAENKKLLKPSSKC